MMAVASVALLLGTSVPAGAVTPQVTGAPGAPTSVTASAGEGSATLSWQAPSSTGSSAITSYTVTASPGGQSLTTSGPWLVATFDGLVDGTSYTFTVAATNAQGTGPASAATTPVTPSHPGGQYQALSPYRVCDTRTGNP